MPTFVRNLVSFNYEVIGEGTPFIFLHGLGSDIEQPKHVFQPIEGIQLIVLDQRSHGKSEITDWESLNFNTLGDDVIGLAKYLKLKEFYLGGISMGAAVSSNVSIRYPEYVKGLVLIRNAWLAQPMEKDIQYWFSEIESMLHDKNGKEKFLQSELYENLKATKPQVVTSLIKFFDDPVARKNPNKFKIMPESKPFRQLEDLKKIQCPTLILSNKQDPIHPYKYGQIYGEYIKNVSEHEITSKVVDEQQHITELNEYLHQFLQP